VGRNDFYNVFTDDINETSWVEAINFDGTLSRPQRGRGLTSRVTRLRLPTRLICVDNTGNPKTSIDIICDKGGAISMQISKIDLYVEPSLILMFGIISVPQGFHLQVEPWQDSADSRY